MCDSRGNVVVRKSEHEEQAAVIQYCRLMEGYDWRWSLVVGIPNQGRRSFGAYRYFLAEGFSPGFPDLVLFCPVGKWAGAAVEMKAQGGKVSDAQKAWLEKLSRAGFLTSVQWSSEGCIAFFQEYLAGALNER
jgi:hypothetical protein